jgi:thioredoxin 1
MASNIIDTSDASFEADVLKSGKPVLVDFWAAWCRPCRMIIPILDEIAAEYDGKITSAKVDVDHNQEVPRQFGVKGIPTLILFNNGQIVAQKVGALSKGQLKEFIDSNL